ncbi:MAG: RCC1 repeat-containing protein, partial [Chloroflexi bacterium]|nr:RCC1 repeat-containing protein [Chloroflexota bacterium]
AAIAAGGSVSVALKSDGTLWAWGANSNGQMGAGLVGFRPAPVTPIGLTGVTGLTGGSVHSMAVKADGTVWTWGDNTNGRLGNNTTVVSAKPVQVLGPNAAGFLTGVIGVATGHGGGHSLAVKGDGTVWAWGSNVSGQLGRGNATSSSTPVQVVGVGGTGFLTDVVFVTAGANHSLAVKSDGTVWAWGVNANGQLGNNSTTQSGTPVQVLGPGGTGFLTGVTGLAAGASHSLAVKSDGTVWTWA